MKRCEACTVSHFCIIRRTYSFSSEICQTYTCSHVSSARAQIPRRVCFEKVNARDEIIKTLFYDKILHNALKPNINTPPIKLPLTLSYLPAASVCPRDSYMRFVLCVKCIFWRMLRILMCRAAEFYAEWNYAGDNLTQHFSNSSSLFGVFVD